MNSQSRPTTNYMDILASRQLVNPRVHCMSTSSVPAFGNDRNDHDNIAEFDERAIETSNIRVGTVMLLGVPIIGLTVDNKERLCLAQISNTLLRDFSYNEIHNRRVALGITCMQCSASQLEILRRTGAMPISSRRCGLITKREAERLVKSFIEDIPPPRLPEDFSFKVHHQCGWGCKGLFQPSRYNSSRAKCIKCLACENYFSPNKFIFHYHKTESSEYKHPDAANFNSWRRHLFLTDDNPPDSLLHAWEDVKAMFNGGCRKRFSTAPRSHNYDVPNNPITPPVPIPQHTSTSGALNFSPYLPFQNNPTSKHSAFPNMFRGITSYGDFFRSLSLPYNNFSSRLPDSAPVLPMFPFTAPTQNMMFPNNGMPILPPPHSSNVWFGRPDPKSTNQEAIDKTTIDEDEGGGREEAEETDEEISVTSQRMDDDKNDNSTHINEIEDDRLDNGNDVKEDYVDVTDDKENPPPETDNTITETENEVVRINNPTDQREEAIELKHVEDEENEIDLSTVTIEELKSKLEKAKQERIEVETERKRMMNVLRLESLKESEMREEFSCQISSLKESLLSELEEEKKTRHSLETKLTGKS
ncbi:hypothetical protein SNE40_012544 [Patella caerulea]|uniref:c-SKI SMAD4-binding domain-containing protein n=1 Tax=Patella caerulea TaxID=87958 RepID=A0AAN8JM24_PATCE